MYIIQETPKLIVQAADDDYAQARQCSNWKISWIAEASKLRHGDLMKVQLPMLRLRVGVNSLSGWIAQSLQLV